MPGVRGGVGQRRGPGGGLHRDEPGGSRGCRGLPWSGRRPGGQAGCSPALRRWLRSGTDPGGVPRLRHLQGRGGRGRRRQGLRLGMSGPGRLRSGVRFRRDLHERGAPAGGYPGGVHRLRGLRGDLPQRSVHADAGGLQAHRPVQEPARWRRRDGGLPRGVQRLWPVGPGRGAGRDCHGERVGSGGLREERVGEPRGDCALPHRRDRLGRRRAIPEDACPQADGGGRMIFGRKDPEPVKPKYPGIPAAVDGTTAVVEVETAASEGAGAYPITPSTQMGEGWAAAVAAGKTNVNGRKLIFFEPAGKRLTYVLNVAARAMTKHALNVHAGHDDYHAVDDTGFFQLFAKGAQDAADLTLIAHRIAELALNPGLCAQDGFLTSHVIESILLPERELIKEYLGDPSDLIASPTPAQRWVFGETRRRIPELFDLDYPVMFGVVQNQDSYQQGVAAQRPFYFDHVAPLADQAFADYAKLTGRSYGRIGTYRLDDAEYVIAGQGSIVANAEAVADYLRETRGLKVGVLNVTMFRPFPADLITQALRARKGVVVLERVDQPLAVDQPVLREIRAAAGKALENGRSRNGQPYPELAQWNGADAPDFYSGCFGLGSRDTQPGDIIAAVENMLPAAKRQRQFYLGIDFVREGTKLPKLQIWQESMLEQYPQLPELALHATDGANLLPKGSISIRIHSVGGWGAITMGKNLALTASELMGLHIKANPKYGSEKKGQPTTFYATLAHEPIRLNCELSHVNVVLSPDPNVFRHSNPLAGMAEGGVFIIQSDRQPEEFWESLPAATQRALRARHIAVGYLDAFKIAMDEASDPELRYRMQGAAFMGAFFRLGPLLEREGVSQEKLFGGIGAQLKKKFGH